MLKPRKLLAAAALTMTAACGGSARPNMRTQAIAPPVTNAAIAPAPASTLAATTEPDHPERSAREASASRRAVPQEAAAPRCDENGRPLAGNVRTKRASDECE